MTERRRHFGLFGRATGVTALLMMAGIGCAENKYADLKAFLEAHDHDVAATDYRLDVPDVIAIKSPTSPELDGATQQIRQDGKVSLSLIGDIKVAGLTPKEFSTKLEGLLSKYYTSPTVVVEVASYESKKVYVFGQVMAVGPKPFTGRDSVLDVLAEAQPNFIAWGSQVKVIRPSPAPEDRREIIVDVDTMMQTGDLSENVLLQEGDIIYVPPTPLGWIGLRLQELRFPFMPAYSSYTMPASFMYATDYYSGSGGTGGRGAPRGLR